VSSLSRQELPWISAVPSTGSGQVWKLKRAQLPCTERRTVWKFILLGVILEILKVIILYVSYFLGDVQDYILAETDWQEKKDGN